MSQESYQKKALIIDFDGGLIDDNRFVLNETVLPLIFLARSKEMKVVLAIRRSYDFYSSLDFLRQVNHENRTTIKDRFDKLSITYYLECLAKVPFHFDAIVSPYGYFECNVPFTPELVANIYPFTLERKIREEFLTFDNNKKAMPRKTSSLETVDVLFKNKQVRKSLSLMDMARLVIDDNPDYLTSFIRNSIGEDKEQLNQEVIVERIENFAIRKLETYYVTVITSKGMLFKNFIFLLDPLVARNIDDFCQIIERIIQKDNLFFNFSQIVRRIYLGNSDKKINLSNQSIKHLSSSDILVYFKSILLSFLLNLRDRFQIRIDHVWLSALLYKTDLKEIMTVSKGFQELIAKFVESSSFSPAKLSCDLLHGFGCFFIKKPNMVGFYPALQLTCGFLIFSDSANVSSRDVDMSSRDMSSYLSVFGKQVYLPNWLSTLGYMGIRDDMFAYFHDSFVEFFSSFGKNDPVVFNLIAKDKKGAIKEMVLQKFIDSIEKVSDNKKIEIHSSAHFWHSDKGIPVLYIFVEKMSFNSNLYIATEGRPLFALITRPTISSAKGYTNIIIDKLELSLSIDSPKDLVLLVASMFRKSGKFEINNSFFQILADRCSIDEINNFYSMNKGRIDKNPDFFKALFQSYHFHSSVIASGVAVDLDAMLGINRNSTVNANRQATVDKEFLPPDQLKYFKRKFYEESVEDSSSPNEMSLWLHFAEDDLVELSSGKVETFKVKIFSEDIIKLRFKHCLSWIMNEVVRSTFEDNQSKEKFIHLFGEDDSVVDQLKLVYRDWSNLKVDLLVKAFFWAYCHQGEDGIIYAGSTAFQRFFLENLDLHLMQAPGSTVRKKTTQDGSLIIEECIAYCQILNNIQDNDFVMLDANQNDSENNKLFLSDVPFFIVRFSYKVIPRKDKNEVEICFHKFSVYRAKDFEKSFEDLLTDRLFKLNDGNNCIMRAAQRSASSKLNLNYNKNFIIYLSGSENLNVLFPQENNIYQIINKDLIKIKTRDYGVVEFRRINYNEICKSFSDGIAFLLLYELGLEPNEIREKGIMKKYAVKVKRIDAGANSQISNIIGDMEFIHCVYEDLTQCCSPLLFFQKVMTHLNSLFKPAFGLAESNDNCQNSINLSYSNSS